MLDAVLEDYLVRMLLSISLIFPKVALAPLFPEKLVLGFEIRSKVVEYVKQRIAKLHTQNPGKYLNCGIAETNAMKYLPNYFKKGQVRIHIRTFLKM
jgi:tRNA G46 methylase TrmB